MRKSSNPAVARARKESLYMKYLDEALIHIPSNKIPTSQICFTELRISPDNGYCDVFVDSRNRDETEAYVAELNKLAGTFRTYLSHEMNTYKVPNIRFYLDPVIDNVIKINNIFDEINNKKQ